MAGYKGLREKEIIYQLKNKYLENQKSEESE